MLNNKMRLANWALYLITTLSLILACFAIACSVGLFVVIFLSPGANSTTASNELSTRTSGLILTPVNLPTSTSTVEDATSADEFSSVPDTPTQAVPDSGITPTATTIIDPISATQTITPTPTSTPLPTNTPTPTNTPAPPPPSEPVITAFSPRPEDCSLDSECIITVTGSWASIEARGNLQLHILVSPFVGGQYQTYYVQAPISIDNAGKWSSAEVYVGQAGDPPGQRFKICALVTEQSFEQGQPLEGLPQGQSVCEEVVKKNVSESVDNSSSPTTAPPPPTPTPSPSPAPASPTPTKPSFTCQSFRPPLEGDVGFNGGVEFQSPRDCDKGLDTTITAGGSYSGGLNGKELWILVYPTDSEYYPQTSDACHMLPADAGGGVWNTIVNFGGPLQQYDLVAVVTNIDNEASQTFKQWLKTGCDTGDYPGYLRRELPSGIQEVGAITVSTAP